MSAYFELLWVCSSSLHIMLIRSFIAWALRVPAFILVHFPYTLWFCSFSFFSRYLRFSCTRFNYCSIVEITASSSDFKRSFSFNMSFSGWLSTESRIGFYFETATPLMNSSGFNALRSCNKGSKFDSAYLVRFFMGLLCRSLCCLDWLNY